MKSSIFFQTHLKLFPSYLGIKTASLSSDSNRSSICTVEESAASTCGSHGSKEMSNGGGSSNGSCNGSSHRTRSPFIGKARAKIDCTPCPYDKDALAFKVRE